MDTSPLIVAPKDNLIRMVALPVEMRAEGDGRTLMGYAAVFNEDTEIDSWEGRFIERIAPGAFKRTLKANKDKIKVLYNHGYDPQIGNKPLGKPARMEEDERGLYVEVPLSRTTYNEDLIALLNDGALDGMSFRFTVTRDKWVNEGTDSGLPERTIQEVKLLEFGPVTFPAYSATTAGVRSLDDFSAWLALTPEQKEAFTASRTSSADAGNPADDPAEPTDAPASSHSSFRTALIKSVINHGLAKRKLAA